MKNFEIDYNEYGAPVYVHVDTGFSQMGGPYNEEEHGWMLTQKQHYKPQTVHDLVYAYDDLVEENNRLRREIWYLKKTYGVK